MVTFKTPDGTEVDLGCGDDVEVALVDPSVQGRLRVLAGQVTSLRPGQSAVWVRGIRVDAEAATVLRWIPSTAPENLTRPPTVCDPGSVG
ncbi:MAG: hypothetical protein JWN35_770 [Frankiales bacterium]|jgi:hypothetical protein|nr:hypothetical protein [Frankiales bacterium]